MRIYQALCEGDLEAGMRVLRQDIASGCIT